jgi:hypothetical protein
VSDSTIRRIDKAAEALSDYMLFKNEFPLTSSIQGDGNFERQFLKFNDRGADAHSLREFDLQTRLLHYPVSYLIESSSFDALPDQVRRLTMKKMAERLHQLTELANLGPGEQKRLQQDFPQYSPQLAEEVLVALRQRKPEFAAIEATLTDSRSDEPSREVPAISD